MGIPQREGALGRGAIERVARSVLSVRELEPKSSASASFATSARYPRIIPARYHGIRTSPCSPHAGASYAPPLPGPPSAPYKPLARSFWDSKDPADWSPDEKLILLGDS